MNSKNHITVLVADDHRFFRKELRKLLEPENDIEVVGEAANGRQAVAMTRKLRPGVVIMDISMPLLNGLEATRQIRQTIPDAKVLILSAHGDDAYIERAKAFGAAGYLIKHASAVFLPEAIREVQKDHTFLSPEVAKKLFRRHK